VARNERESGESQVRFLAPIVKTENGESTGDALQLDPKEVSQPAVKAFETVERAFTGRARKAGVYEVEVPLNAKTGRLWGWSKSPSCTRKVDVFPRFAVASKVAVVANEKPTKYCKARVVLKIGLKHSDGLQIRAELGGPPGLSFTGASGEEVVPHTDMARIVGGKNNQVAILDWDTREFDGPKLMYVSLYLERPDKELTPEEWRKAIENLTLDRTARDTSKKGR
jgi:hypothetical protein